MSDEKKDPSNVVLLESPAETLPSSSDAPVQYKLYKRRFTGCVGLSLLNVVTAMSWPWFGPISNNMVAEFGITLDQVNWLGNLVCCVALLVALLVPLVCNRYGLRRCLDIGAVALLLSAWIRYAGTLRSLPINGAYALLILGQFFAAVATPIFQVLVPKYSETWFGLKGRTTATMVMSISYVVGGAIGQLISPMVGSTRKSILVLGIISTAASPAVFLIAEAPPTPPTHSGGQKPPTLSSLLRAVFGKDVPSQERMTFRERLDFICLTTVFATLVGSLNTFGILTGEVLNPVGYSATTCGILGATLLLTGILAAIVTAPLFDRVFTHHLALTGKLIVPIVAVSWLALIWAVKPHNIAGLFVIMILLGTGSITLLPIALELACELTRNADGSSAILWFAGNLLCAVFLIVQGSLRAGPDAHPPLNMHRALIFNATVVMVCSSFVFGIQGKLARKELDEQKQEVQTAAMTERRAVSS